jgi:single-stranded-DNA-specific exonuclease
MYRTHRPNWTVRPRDYDFETQLSASLGLPSIVGSVLRNRGIDTVEKARDFLTPSLSLLHDPFRLHEMSAAVDRIAFALANRETILVHGDYDVDGVTSAALLIRFLSKLGGDIQYYIPHRMHDRYGLGSRAIQQAADAGVKLVIAVDCGVSDREAVAVARQRGMDVIIVDHHEPPEELPEGAIIVDPKRTECDYPERELASVGLAFKVASALCERLKIPAASMQRAFLDLVALGTIADVAPLLGENRIMTSAGLQLMPQTRKVGLQALMRLCNLGDTVRASDVAFRLAPRINAVGRMGDAADALELFLTDDEVEATRLALHLDSLNRQRQQTQEATFREAFRRIEEEIDLDEHHVVVLSAPHWHAGVLGIVAAKVLQAHGRPAILLTEEDGEMRGSARSIPGFDIAAALEQCSGCLLRYGGHSLAAGLALNSHDLEEFRQRLNAIAADSLAGVDLSPRIEADAEVTLSEITPDLIAGLDRVQPCGHGNAVPLFMASGVEILECRAVGGDGQHLKLYVTQDGRTLDCIGFGLGGECENHDRRDEVDLCFTPEFNEYNGSRGLQLRLEGIRPAS